MNNRSSIELKRERRELTRQLKREGCEVLNTIFDLGDKATPMHYLAKSIEVMSDADIVLFMPGWEKAKGCIIEHEVALKYGKYVKEL